MYNIRTIPEKFEILYFKYFLLILTKIKEKKERRRRRKVGPIFAGHDLPPAYCVDSILSFMNNNLIFTRS